MKLRLRLTGVLILLCTLCVAQDDFLIGALQQGSGGGPNLYTGNNAAQPTPGEVDGTANTRTGGGAYTITSSSTPTSQNGTYYLRWERNSVSGNADGLIDFDGLPTGVLLTIKVYTQEIIGTNYQFRMTTIDGWDSNKTQNITSGAGWIEQTITGIATVQDPTLGIRSTTLGVSGDVIGMDNIRITQD